MPRIIYFRYSTGNADNEVLSSRRTREGCWEAVCGRPRVEQPLVQILVVVANTQVEFYCLRTEVEKGFISIASTYE